MLAALILIAISMTFFGVILPVAKFTIQRQTEHSEKLFKAWQAITIREYYPELKDIPYHELAKRYDLDRTYHRINWSRY